MIDLRKLIEWRGQNQYAFAKSMKIDQGGISKILSGESSLSSKLEDKIICRCTPHVDFICHSPYTATSVNVLLMLKKNDIVEHDPDAFDAALRAGKRIIVVTNDKTPFLAMIKRALKESGLPQIYVEAARVNDQGNVEPWND